MKRIALIDYGQNEKYKIKVVKIPCGKMIEIIFLIDHNIY